MATDLADRTTTDDATGKEKISISIPRDLLEFLDREQIRTGESRSLIIRQLIRRHLIDTATVSRT